MNLLRLTLCAAILFAAACGKQRSDEEAARPVEPLVSTTNLPANASLLITNNPTTNAIATNAVVNEKTSESPGEELYKEAVAAIRLAKEPLAVKDALELFREAAELGYPAAQHALGVWSFSGLGIPKSMEEALNWFQKSAAQGYADAEFKIASLYMRGEGAPADETKALEFLRRAAAQGHAEAQYNLATLYSTGKSVPKDAAEAAQWFRKAAEAGHPIAQSNLGVLYASGEGFEKSMEEALQWWRQAAEQGQSSAQFNLAQALLEGKALPKDLVEAYRWYYLAADQGDRDAMRMRDALAVELAPAELAEALKRAREFKGQLHARQEARKEKLF